MNSPTNSPISDPTPAFALPEMKNAVPRIAKSDWNKLGQNRKYKSIDAYIEARKEYWRHFLPGGEAVRDLAAQGKYKEAGEWSVLASVIVDELDTFQFRVQKELGK
jgi:hypothetical protein